MDGFCFQPPFDMHTYKQAPIRKVVSSGLVGSMQRNSEVFSLIGVWGVFVCDGASGRLCLVKTKHRVRGRVWDV